MQVPTNYTKVKKLYPDHIVLYRIGDFLEAFNEDAKTVAQVCDIVLTRMPDGGVWLAGFPHFAADRYIALLTEAGHKVALAEPAI